MCGGTVPPVVGADHVTGLSPRVRGNRLKWSIPACAGEPGPACFGSDGYEVYPRVCGGTLDNLLATLNLVGSIPACAGEPHEAHDREAVVLRSIPACAGEPQLRGTLAPWQIWGLSPRVRGNLSPPARGLRVRGMGYRRSIPACAGEPGDDASFAGVVPLGSIPACAGEPCPRYIKHVRMRSIPACAGEPTTASRSIPACAGEPTGLSDLCAMKTVYPRVCGGTRARPAILVYPRVCGGTPWRSLGSIPACAGEPHSRS